MGLQPNPIPQTHRILMLEMSHVNHHNHRKIRRTWHHIVSVIEAGAPLLFSSVGSLAESLAEPVTRVWPSMAQAQARGM
jgi:hypothetical protein